MSAPLDLVIRTERDADHAGVREVVSRAFGTAEEADLVDALRAQAVPLVSLVAADGERLVGHVMCSPVGLATRPDLRLMGLAPVAVLPDRQREGTGGLLVRAAIGACVTIGAHGIVVLGHPGYYPRFGFLRASGFGLRCPYDAPDDSFMALELVPGALAGARGTITYHSAFPSS